MLIQAIKDLMIKKYDNHNVYIHNLSKFDGIFLLKILANLGQIKPLIHHGDLISIGFKFINNNPTLSSLALGIFRTHFLRNDEIPQLSGHIAKDIIQGYTGGAVDVYTPQNEKGTKI